MKKTSLNIPLWLSEEKDRIIAVNKYEQDRNNGFLIINFDKDDYDKMRYPEPLSIETDNNGNEYYVFDKNAYQTSIQKIIDRIKELGEHNKLEQIKSNYNVDMISFSTKETQKSARKPKRKP